MKVFFLLFPNLTEHFTRVGYFLFMHTKKASRIKLGSKKRGCTYFLKTRLIETPARIPRVVCTHITTHLPVSVTPPYISITNLHPSLECNIKLVP